MDHFIILGRQILYNSINTIISLDWETLYPHSSQLCSSIFHSWTFFLQGTGKRDFFIIKKPTFKVKPTLFSGGRVFDSLVCFFMDNIQRLALHYKLYLKYKPTFLSLYPLLSCIRQDEENLLNVEKMYLNLYHFFFLEKKREGLETMIWELQREIRGMEDGRTEEIMEDGRTEDILVSVPLWFFEQYVGGLEKVNDLIHEVEQIIFHLNLLIPLTVFVFASVCLFFYLRYYFFLKRRKLPFLFIVFFYLLLVVSFFLLSCTALLLNRYFFLKKLIQQYQLSLVYYFFFLTQTLRKRRSFLFNFLFNRKNFSAFLDLLKGFLLVASAVVFGLFFQGFFAAFREEGLIGVEGLREEEFGEEFRVALLQALREIGLGEEVLGEEFTEAVWVALVEEFKRRLRRERELGDLFPGAARAA